MSELTIKDVVEFITYADGIKLKKIIECVGRGDLEFIQNAVNIELTKRNAQGLVPLLAITDGIINIKFYRLEDFDKAVEHLKQLSTDNIEQQASRRRTMIGVDMSVTSKLSIQTIKIHADEVNHYLEL